MYPLGLPEGSVRAIIALVVVATTMAYWVIWKTVPGELMGFCGIIIGYYFGVRQGQKIGQAEEIIKNGKSGTDTR